MSRRPSTRTIATGAVAALVAALAVASPAAAKKPPAPPTGTQPVVVTTLGPGTLQLTADRSGRTILAPDAFLGTITAVDRASSATATVATDLGSAPAVALQGKRLYVVRTAGEGGPGEQSPTYLSRVQRGGGVVDLVDLLALERRLNPDRQVPGEDAESNPYDVIAYRGGFIVADAGANALWRVFANGEAGVLTALPLLTTGPCATEQNQGQVGCDPVPTGLALGPDGYLYVSGLGSFVAGQIWKVDPRTGRIVQTIAGPPGAPPLTDIAVARDGTIFVSSIVAGRVYRLQGTTWTSVAVPAATGLVIARGVLYAASAPAAFGVEEEETGGEAPAGPPPPSTLYAIPPGAFGPTPAPPAP